MTGKQAIIAGVLFFIIVGCVLVALAGGAGWLLYSRSASSAEVVQHRPAEPVLIKPPAEQEPELKPTLSGRIVFQTNRDNVADDVNEIYVMNADGSEQVNLTNHPANDTEPAWSPDGSRIAFVSNRDGNSEIYVMNADGSNPINLTNNEAEDLYPAWSPDGTRIAFISNRDWLAAVDIQIVIKDKLYNIYTIDVDSLEQTRLTRFLPEEVPGFEGSGKDSENYLHPSWSPDGTQLVFVYAKGMTAALPRGLINVMNVDGSGVVQLTTNEYATPAWSPDGTQIVAQGSVHQELVVMNADGSGLTELENGMFQLDGAGPVWSPDGTRIIFANNKEDDDGSYEILIAKPDGRNMLQLTDTPRGGDSKAPSWIP